MSFEGDHCLAANHGKWTIYQRITSTVDLREVGGDFSNPFSIDGDELRQAQLPLAKIYIYCAPCACLIQAALSICQKSSSFLEILVRPDDRITASCRPEGIGVDGLVSLLNEIKITEARGGASIRTINCIDRLWIEQRLFRIEEVYQPQRSRHISYNNRHIFTEVCGDKKCIGIVILGEVNHSRSMMHTPPFPPTARLPRETEIFQMKRRGGIWERKYLGTYTPNNFEPNMSPYLGVAGLRPPTAPVTPTVLPPVARSTSPPPGPSSKRLKRPTVTESSEDEDTE